MRRGTRVGGFHPAASHVALLTQRVQQWFALRPDAALNRLLKFESRLGWGARASLGPSEQGAPIKSSCQRAGSR
jgi:hypothetical protein